MASSVTLGDLQSSAGEILKRLAQGEPSIVIEEQGHAVGVLVSPDEFERLRRQRGERAVSVMDRFHALMEASGAGEDELHELERALDRKAS